MYYILASMVSIYCLDVRGIPIVLVNIVFETVFALTYSLLFIIASDPGK